MKTKDFKKGKIAYKKIKILVLLTLMVIGIAICIPTFINADVGNINNYSSGGSSSSSSWRI